MVQPDASLKADERAAAPLLRGAGLRVTAARAAVLAALARAGRPLSHQEIARLPVTRGFDRVTLYRTLAALQRARIVHRAYGTDGVWRFGMHVGASERCGGDHVHFFCVRCNGMACLPEQRLPWVEPPSGAEVLGKQLLVYGVCGACRMPEARRRARPSRSGGDTTAAAPTALRSKAGRAGRRGGAGSAGARGGTGSAGARGGAGSAGARGGVDKAGTARRAPCPGRRDPL